jgi:hypothetical protein
MTTSSIRKILFAGFVSVFQLSLCLPSFGQGGDEVESIAQREVARRQAALPQGQEAIARGQRAMAERNFAAAHEEFRTAVALLPDTVVSGNLHDEAMRGFCDSGVKLA